MLQGNVALEIVYGLTLSEIASVAVAVVAVGSVGTTGVKWTYHRYYKEDSIETHRRKSIIRLVEGGIEPLRTQLIQHNKELRREELIEGMTPIPKIKKQLERPSEEVITELEEEYDEVGEYRAEVDAFWEDFSEEKTSLREAIRDYNFAREKYIGTRKEAREELFSHFISSRDNELSQWGLTVNQNAAEAATEMVLSLELPSRRKGWMDDNWDAILKEGIPRVRRNYRREIVELEEWKAELLEDLDRCYTMVAAMKKGFRKEYEFSEADLNFEK